MTCYRKSTLNAVNTTAQTLAANSLIALTSANVTGQSIAFTAGTTPATLQKAGLYLVAFNANLVGTAVGAVTLQLLNNNNELHKISIIPRQFGALGFTMNLPSEDKFLFSKDEFLNEIQILFAGKVCEQVFFQHETNGSSNDILKANV